MYRSPILKKLLLKICLLFFVLSINFWIPEDIAENIAKLISVNLGRL